MHQCALQPRKLQLKCACSTQAPHARGYKIDSCKQFVGDFSDKIVPKKCAYLACIAAGSNSSSLGSRATSTPSDKPPGAQIKKSQTQTIFINTLKTTQPMQLICVGTKNINILAKSTNRLMTNRTLHFTQIIQVQLRLYVYIAYYSCMIIECMIKRKMLFSCYNHTHLFGSSGCSNLERKKIGTLVTN